ncbi:hypothetical protein M2323_004664, partial [Rhodoblastus acidophilus]|uniref:M15 family metallopeptidase n=1 Tax=Rhodoblastus acidophilus TaxID=1074 RepID=UPI002227486A
DLTLCIDTESQTITLMQYDQSVILTVDHLEQSCRHVPTNGFGHAVDLAPVVNGVIPWKDWSKFASVARAMKAAASQVHVSITWGGDWKTFKDGPHFELPKNLYP